MSLYRQLPSAELGVERSAAIVAGSSAPRSMISPRMKPSMPYFMPSVRRMADCPRAASMMPIRLALMTLVGPPLWPIIALP